MKWFFASEENQKKLIEEIKEWRGTPFRHFAGVKKAGADCIHFVFNVYENIGAVPNATKFIPWYSYDWCHHTSEQKLYDGLSKHPSFVEVNYTDPKNGDMILYQFGKAASHCGIYFNGNVHQSICFLGVSKMYYKDRTWLRRRRFAFRIRYV